MKYIVYLACVLAFSTSYAGSYDDFFRAVVRDDVVEIRQLVARGFDPNARDPNGQPAVTRALLADSPLAALALIQLPGFDVEANNRAGETPLMMAALKGRADVCEALIERGAAVNRAGWTPLHYAATGNSLAALTLLLARGAEVNARSAKGRTALMMAAQYGSEEIIDALISAGADAGAKDDRGARAADGARAAGREYLAIRLEAPPAAR